MDTPRVAKRRGGGRGIGKSVIQDGYGKQNKAQLNGKTEILSVYNKAVIAQKGKASYKYIESTK